MFAVFKSINRQNGSLDFPKDFVSRKCWPNEIWYYILKFWDKNVFSFLLIRRKCLPATADFYLPMLGRICTPTYYLFRIERNLKRCKGALISSLVFSSYDLLRLPYEILINNENMIRASFKYFAFEFALSSW